MRILEIFDISRFSNLRHSNLSSIEWFMLFFPRVDYIHSFSHYELSIWFLLCKWPGQGFTIQTIFIWLDCSIVCAERKRERSRSKKWLNAMHCQRTQWIRIENDFKRIYFNQMSIEMLGSLLAPAFRLIFPFNI